MKFKLRNCRYYLTKGTDTSVYLKYGFKITEDSCVRGESEIEIESLEDLKKLCEDFNQDLVISFEDDPSIIIYDGYLE